MNSRLKCIFARIFNILAIVSVLHYQLCADLPKQKKTQDDCIISMCDIAGRESRLEYLRIVAMFQIRQPE